MAAAKRSASKTTRSVKSTKATKPIDDETQATAADHAETDDVAVDDNEAEVASDDDPDDNAADDSAADAAPPRPPSARRAHGESDQPRKKKRGRLIFLIIILMLLTAGAVYWWQHRAANRQIADLQAKITQLNRKNADLQSQNNDLQSQLNDAKQAANQGADADAITTRVKYIFNAWLKTAGSDQSATIASLQNQNYITSQLAATLRNGGQGGQDPLLCATTAADNYLYDTPALLSTTSATEQVTGKYASQPNTAITLSLNKTAGKWITNGIDCAASSQ